MLVVVPSIEVVVKVVEAFVWDTVVVEPAGGAKVVARPVVGCVVVIVLVVGLNFDVVLS